ncbi:MAG: hypothetical protein H0U55_04345, partial [Rubrobacteraceae bacterium]|nr:hypothetical protein [Rubrobacteraceae bacterium]
MDGTLYRLDSDTLDPTNRPLALSYRTQRGDGYADASVNLRRSILRDWPDLNLIDTWRFIAGDGTVVYEGRVNNIGRETNDGQQINVQLSGWMQHAKDRRMREIYIDRDLSRWITPPSNARQLVLLAGAVKYLISRGSSEVQRDPVSAFPAVRLGITRLVETATSHSLAETWYDAQGLTLGYYGGTYADRDETNAVLVTANWSIKAFLSSDDVASSTDSSANLTGGTSTFTVTATGTRKYAILAMNYVGVGTADTDSSAWFRNLYVVGTHGLTLSSDGGLTVSQIIKDSAARFCPRLDTTNVQDTTYAQRHVAYLEPIYPHDAWLDLNRAHLWELSVWENRKLYYEPPATLDDYDWQVRTDDPGVTLSFGGDSLTELANGVEVTFTDLLSGKTRLVTPVEYPVELADTSTDNPANKNGLNKWLAYEVPFPCLEADAVQYGRAYLAEGIRAKAPVSITCGFHIRDRAGNWQPASKVRCGQRVAITDHPNDAPRRIIDTSYSHDGRGLTISADRA